MEQKPGSPLRALLLRQASPPESFVLKGTVMRAVGAYFTHLALVRPTESQPFLAK